MVAKKSKMSQDIEKSKLTNELNQSYKRYAHGFDRPSLLLNLEARVMYDGAAATAIDEVVADTESQSPENLSNIENSQTQEQMESTEDTSSDDAQQFVATVTTKGLSLIHI